MAVGADRVDDGRGDRGLRHPVAEPGQHVSRDDEAEPQQPGTRAKTGSATAMRAVPPMAARRGVSTLIREVTGAPMQKAIGLARRKSDARDTDMWNCVSSRSGVSM